jgi:sulfonate transport system permease protein
MKKKKRKPKKRTQIERLAGPALLLLVWIVGSATGAIPSRDLPGPKKVAHTGWELIENGKLIEALGHSMERVAIGLAIGVVAGVLLALIAALSRVGDDLIDAPMQMARTLPVLALVPLVVVWLGIGELP